MEEKASYVEAETHQFDLCEDVPYWKLPEKLRALGITDVFDSPHSHSDKSSADFLMALRHAKDWIENKASLYARENRKLKDLDALLKYDPVTDFAKRFKWRGMYDDKSEFHDVYLKFNAEWRAEKMEKFVELVQEYKKTKRSWKPVAVAAAGLVALVAGAFASYHYYLKPDIKNEIQQSASGTIDSAIERIRPEIKKEIQQLMPDFDKMYDSFIARAKPEVKEMLGAFKDDIKKELVEIYRAEKKSFDEDFDDNIELAFERVMKERGLDKWLKMIEDK